MREIPKYSGCFVCGDRNERGLRARFFYDGSKAVTEIEAGQDMEGYRGIYHGGILATVLDEVMIKALLASNVVAVTAELTIRYLAPVRTGDRLRFSGWVTGQKGRVSFTEGEVENGDQQLCATATAKYIEAKADFRAELEKSLDR